jgi:hypothetical protein
LAGDKGEPSDTRKGDNADPGVDMVLDEDAAPAPPVAVNALSVPPGDEPLPPAARKADSRLPTPLIEKND